MCICVCVWGGELSPQILLAQRLNPNLCTFLLHWFSLPQQRDVAAFAERAHLMLSGERHWIFLGRALG